MKEVTIVDCGTGNISSVMNAMKKAGANPIVSSDPKKIGRAKAIILPGVGLFGYFMQELRARKLEEPVKKALEEDRKFLGICLGLQALFEESEESLGVKGLSVFKGKVVKFKKGKVPQIGWNKIICKKNASSRSIFFDSYMYFVNSYYAAPEDRSIIAAMTDYYGNFTSAVSFKNITAVQFHPEKSGNFGLELLRKWLEC